VLLKHLRYLDITYCENLKELPELPLSIMKLFADDHFALQSIEKLPTMYKELYMVSFANWKMQEMWYASRRESSVLQVGNCQKEDVNAMLQKNLFSFLSMMQLKVCFLFLIEYVFFFLRFRAWNGDLVHCKSVNNKLMLQ